MKIYFTLFFLLFAYCCANVAQTIHVQFESSCPEVELKLNRAVSLLHHFRLEEARQSFIEITLLEPSCAIAYWGVAMTFWDQTRFFPPSKSDHLEGNHWIDRAYEVGRQEKKANLLEKHLIRALYAFYLKSYKEEEAFSQYYERVEIYTKRMEEAYQENRKSLEMKAFYALSIHSSQVWFARRNRAKVNIIIDLCKEILRSNPNHPGAIHYILRAYSEPELVSKAIPHIATYENLEPAADPFVLSSLYTLLGDWTKVIGITAREVSLIPSPLNYKGILYLDQLVNAYTQTAQFQRALDTIESHFPQKYQVQHLSDGTQFLASFYYSNMMGRIWVESLKWKELSKFSDKSGFLESEYGTMIEMIENGLNSLGYFYLNDQESLMSIAKDQMLVAKTLHTAVPQLPLPNAVKNDLNRYTLFPEVLLKYVLGGVDVSIQDLQEMAETHETAWHFTPVTSLHEIVGYMQWKNGRNCEAFESFSKSLRVWPNRYSATFSAAVLAEKCGKKEEAVKLFTQFLVLHEGADSQPTDRFRQATKYIENAQDSGNANVPDPIDLPTFDADEPANTDNVEVQGETEKMEL